MIRRPPRSTRTDTLFPYTTLFRSRRHQPHRDLPLRAEIGVAPRKQRLERAGERKRQRETQHEGCRQLAEPIAAADLPRRHGMISFRWRSQPITTGGIVPDSINPNRSEDRRLGTECVSPCSSWGASSKSKKKTK